MGGCAVGDDPGPVGVFRVSHNLAADSRGGGVSVDQPVRTGSQSSGVHCNRGTTLGNRVACGAIRNDPGAIGILSAGQGLGTDGHHRRVHVDESMVAGGQCCCVDLDRGSTF